MESVKNIPLHTRVYIELDSGERFMGTLKAYNSKFRFVELNELSDTVSKQKIYGAQTFYESEIEAIRALDVTPSNSVESPESSSESEPQNLRHYDVKSLQSEQMLPISIDIQSQKSEPHKSHQKVYQSELADSSLYGLDESMESITTSISDAEQAEIQERIRTAIYITQCDSSYHEALNDLYHQEIVGLNIEGSRLGRLQRGSLLSFSTNSKIYLFDLLTLGRIFPEMKRILEAEKPRKVVHNSCLIVDHLKHRFKCQLNGIQDTLITHFQIKKQKRVISIDDCLREYFNLPKPHHPNIRWEKRPMSDRRKFIAATNVAYLIKLFFHMSVDIFLRPLKRMTNEYAQTYSQNDDTVDIFDQIANRKNPGLESIETDANNLYAYTLLDLSEVE